MQIPSSAQQQFPACPLCAEHEARPWDPQESKAPLGALGDSFDHISCAGYQGAREPGEGVGEAGGFCDMAVRGPPVAAERHPI